MDEFPPSARAASTTPSPSGGPDLCGTMSSSAGPGPHLLDVDEMLRLVLKGVETANGMGFSRIRSTYFTDSGKRRSTASNITGRRHQPPRALRACPRAKGRPMVTVDSKGYVWSARWDGGRVVRYTPDGQEDCASSCGQEGFQLTFGGNG